MDERDVEHEWCGVQRLQYLLFSSLAMSVDEVDPIWPNNDMLAEMGILKSVDDRSIVLLFFSSSDAEKKNRIIA